MGSDLYSCHGGGWLLDCGAAVDGSRAADFISSSYITDGSPASTELEVDLARKKENSFVSASRKRSHVSLGGAAGTKACREKMRRDRLNERFIELSMILDRGKSPKSDKFAILTDATCQLNQLRLEVLKLQESNEKLRGAIKSLKVEKSELRDEKLMLKTDKDQVEQMLRGTGLLPSPFVAHPAVAFYPAALAACNKSNPRPKPSYSPAGMWQWLPPSSLDTSQDHMLRPPVA